MLKVNKTNVSAVASISLLTALSAISPAYAETSTASPITASDSKVSSIVSNSDALVTSQLEDPLLQAQNVTSVSQLSDVRPTDWAFTALQSLVERYGCIAGYPDKTYRGNQATTRYEFAAGLNACLDKINEIISAGLADKVSQEDLATLQKLQEEFAAELATLRGRVDALDAKVAKLEAQQFSTTTKLTGEAILSLTTGTGGPNNVGSNLTFGNRTRLVLNTSFTGKDMLRTRLEAGNNLAAASNSVDNNPGSLATTLGTNSARIGPGTATGATNNSFGLSLLDYKFPVFDDKVTLYIAPISFADEFFTVLSPVASNGQGSISRFGRFDPFMRINSNSTTSSLIGFDWKVTDKFKIQAGYSSLNPNLATGSGGLFGGSTSVMLQMLFKPADNLDASLAYANTYHQTNTLGTGLVNATNTGTESIPGVTGPIRANTLVGNLAWKANPKLTLFTWGAVIFADAVNTTGSTTFTSWIAGLTLNDLFSEGSMGSVLFGQPIKPASGNVGPVNSTPYHLELFYRYRVSKNISITPGVFFVFNPEGISTNSTATVGVVRTTFTF